MAAPADLISQSDGGRSQALAAGGATESEEGEAGSLGQCGVPSQGNFLEYFLEYKITKANEPESLRWGPLLRDSGPFALVWGPLTSSGNH